MRINRIKHILPILTLGLLISSASAQLNPRTTAGKHRGTPPAGTTLAANAGADFTCYAGEAVRLDGTGSRGYILESQSDGKASVVWDMGDGNTAENIIKPAHAYLTPGTYTARLTVKNSSGNSTYDTATVTVLAITAAQTRTLTDSGDPEVNRINLQAAIDAVATDNGSSEVVVPAGFTANEPIILPARSSTNYVTIRTSGDLPAKQRATKADVGQMFKLRARGASESRYNLAVIINGGSNYYRLVGLYIERSGSLKNDVIAVDNPSNTKPSHIILDRIVVDGNGTDTIRGIAPNGNYFSILNSSILDIKANDSESKAIGAWTANGPLAVVNNRLEAASLNVIIGGAAVTSASQILDGFEFRGNYVWKSPDWVVADGQGKGYAVKNLFELKCGLNVVAAGNIFENNYADGQQGEAILIKSTNYDPWAEVRGLDFRNNKILNTRAGFDVAGLAMDGSSSWPAAANHIRFYNNYWAERNDRGDLAITPDFFEVNHNTFVATGPKSAFLHLETAPAGRVGTGLRILNNATFTTTYGAIISSFGEGAVSLNNYFSGWDVRGNIFPGAISSAYPLGNFFAIASGQVGIDGAIPGANMIQLDAATQTASTGRLP